MPLTLAVLAGLLILVSVIQRLAARFALPSSVLVALAGIALGTAATLMGHASGSIGTFAHAIGDLPIDADVFLYIFLPALLFQSALTIEVRQMVEDAAPILLLAVVAVVVATGVIGFALAPIAGVSLVACLMLGAIVATTDPVAVIGIFRDVGAPSRLTRLVEGESLLNDAAAIALFSVLLDMLIGGGHGGVGSATVTFLREFIGGIAVGVVGARIVIAMLGWLRDLRFAQTTLTLALPYLVYIIGERALGVSGVVASVTSGLVLSAIGQPRLAPDDWKFLNEMWEQLAFWASSLIFILAALVVPHLLGEVTWRDAGVLLALVLAALVARAIVMFGMLPALSAVKLSQRVDHRYKAVIIWGGLRGAVTLALALAVTENNQIGPDVQRFIAVLATGFVLFTLLVNGLTLKPLIRVLRLDRLSPFDQVLRAQVLARSREHVVETVKTIGKQYRFGDEVSGNVAASYGSIAAPGEVKATSGSDDDRVRLALVSLATREREVILEQFAARTVSGRIVEELLANVDNLIDRTRGRGRAEYLLAARQSIGFTRGFRIAHFWHRRFGIDGPLVDRLANRFERLLVSRIVLEEIGPHVERALAPLVGERLTPALQDALEQRRQMTDSALEAFRAQYPQYAGLLERRFLHRIAIRHESVEYRTLFEERLIGPELYGALERELHEARAQVDLRPRLDLGLDIRTLIARVPILADLAHKELDAVARRLRPQIAMPDERIISTGERGDRMYFISSGVVRVDAGGRQFLLTGGDFFGEMALILDRPRQADVTSLSYCQLLVLEARDLQALRRSSRDIREHLDRAAAAREKENRA